MTKRPLLFASLLIATPSVMYLACDDSNPVKEGRPTPNVGPDSSGGGLDDASTGDASSEGGPKDCFDNPKTHFEIINACTTAVKITKNPTLPKLLVDGGLPPLN